MKNHFANLFYFSGKNSSQVVAIYFLKIKYRFGVKNHHAFLLSRIQKTTVMQCGTICLLQLFKKAGDIRNHPGNGSRSDEGLYSYCRYFEAASKKRQEQKRLIS
jgi:hypothetical protein